MRYEWGRILAMLIYGKQPIYYYLERHPEKIQTLYLAKEVEKKEYSRLMKMGFEVKRIPQEAAQKMSKNSNHQGFLADIDEIAFVELYELQKADFILILNGITDVGNIGAIVRSAYAFGVDAIIISGLKKLALEPIVRSSTGALVDIPLVLYHNLYDLMHEVKQAGIKIYGADMNGEDIRDVQVKGRRALLLGSESSGIPSRALAKLDKTVKIEMMHGFDSLNVSVAGAILMDRMR